MEKSHFDENKERIWDSFPQLTTLRLILREITPMDNQRIFEMWSNPLVNRYTDFPELDDPKVVEKVISLIRERFETKNGLRWGICLKEDGKMIGTMGFNRWVTREANFAVLGYDFDPAYWRQGFGFEAGSAVVGYGFEQMKLHRIEADITPINIASEMLLRKLGFQHEGIRREAGYWGGKYQTMSIFSKLSSD